MGQAYYKSPASFGARDTMDMLFFFNCTYLLLVIKMIYPSKHNLINLDRFLFLGLGDRSN